MSLRAKLGSSYRLLKLLTVKYKWRLGHSNGQKPTKKEILFVADGSLVQGGLVDRLKGIVSLFELTKKYNCHFYIHFTSPFNLTDFLLPNSINWLPDKQLEFIYPIHKPLILIDSGKKEEEQIHEAINKLKVGQRLDVYLNQDIMRPDIDHNTVWKNAFKELFSLSPALKKELDSFSIIENSIAVHIRFLNAFGEYLHLYPKRARQKFSVFTGDQRKKLEELFFNEINKMLSENSERKVYLFCDSNYFMKRAHEKYQNAIEIIPGEIRHSEDAEVSGFEAHKKTFIDFLLMSKCSEVVMLKSKETYNSSFSKYAAIVGGKTFRRQEIEAR